MPSLGTSEAPESDKRKFRLSIFKRNGRCLVTYRSSTPTYRYQIPPTDSLLSPLNAAMSYLEIV